MAPTISAGDLAPGFELPDQDGNAGSLAGLRGRRVFVCLYPKADTPRE